ncbi:unnamed protein product [Diatraea saccharalis]|uniref:Odorant receptor n=1 Tax=Diatraea saccharalis TaxID=40085 RepID=A0A9N9R9J6_9NEOP|nr:unnamed protein product [Diatraea saccharalis]
MIAGTWITAFDTTILVTMVFFRAEFELLRIDSVDIFGTENAQVPDEIALKRLKECHKRHVELIKYANLFDDSLSLIMFLYALVCSLVLCLTAYQMTSMDLSRAPYESIWWTRSVAHRKNLCMLTNQFSKIVRFSVGPFTTLTVATFIQFVTPYK